MIDTQKTNRELLAAGFSQDQSDALLAMAERIQDDLVTKDYLRAELAERLGNLKTELIYWIVGTVGVALVLIVIGAVVTK